MPKFLFALLLVFFASSATAQSDKKLLISSPDFSAECFLDPTSALRVLPSGDVEATVTAEGSDCTFGLGGLALTDLFLESEEPGPGDPFTIQWASTSEEACQASGDLPGWPAADIGTRGPTTAVVTSTASAGAYQALVICGEGANSVQSALTVNVAAQPAPSAPSLSVSPSSVSQGDSFTISWSSSNASSCTASGTLSGWGGTKATSGSQTITTTGSTQTGSFSVALACSNSGGSSPTTTRTVSIEAPSACGPERSLPSDWPQLTTGSQSCLWVPGVGFDASADCRTWAPGIWDSQFLDTGGATRRIVTNRNSDGKGFVAIELSTAGMTVNARGEITSASGGPGIQFSRRLATISSCPGDFNKPAIDQETGCYFELTGLSGSVRWGGTNSGRTCQLEANRTYYLNIIASDSPVGTPPDELQPAATCVDNSNNYRCGAVYGPAVDQQ